MSFKLKRGYRIQTIGRYIYTYVVKLHFVGTLFRIIKFCMSKQKSVFHSNFTFQIFLTNQYFKICYFSRAKLLFRSTRNLILSQKSAFYTTFRPLLLFERSSPFTCSFRMFAWSSQLFLTTQYRRTNRQIKKQTDIISKLFRWLRDVEICNIINIVSI